MQESDEDKDDESVRHVGYSPNSSREELSYHGNNHHGNGHWGGRATSPLGDQDYASGRGQANNHVHSATESESEDEYVF